MSPEQISLAYYITVIVVATFLIAASLLLNHEACKSEENEENL